MSDDLAGAPVTVPGRTVVTGAAGFIGSHVAEALLGYGSQVLGIDSCLRDPDGVGRNLAPLERHDGFRLLRADLLDVTAEEFEGVDTVFHLAAQPGVRTSWGSRFGQYCDSNILATHRVMEAAAAAGVRRVVVSSSSSVYGRTDVAAFDESLAPSPMSPYGVTKLAGEQLALVHAMRPDATVSVIALRYFTVYGPRQRDDMAIGRMIRAALTGEPMTVFGDGRQQRDFTFVGDVVRANLLAMGADARTAVVNVGTGEIVTVLDLLDLVGEVTGRPVPVTFAPAEAGDVPFTRADVKEAERVIGYRSAVSLREGLQRQLEWMSATGGVPGAAQVRPSR
ncbi:putative UDP-glucose epimerase YtcB [Actinoplanes sp. NBRC 14428]|uniref:Nucleoside-diphosphate-sugar epimerase n=1 Tax=Pseudosporangium ferrugineum TaxID=439699 RepID=A0A2T0RXB5_9ACTN|nr:NAD-dependent epimerase/dehydratase family protein [Pseudosporangium ferrugineum]PRY25798.1 nucleoside-diphosphate-sugar epimerase [Pseudosporangium ferrugineum]BCJ56152.1 putative UDP-glucose epimerase YtcB [Actinoplanes sp. NBRC 14428]